MAERVPRPGAATGADAAPHPPPDEGGIAAPPAVDAAPDAGGPPQGSAHRSRYRRWLLAVLAICVVALGLRVGYVLGWKQVDEIGGDAYYYHRSAQLLADGEGFVHPYFFDQGVRAPGADHPPGYTVVLAVPSLLGFDTILSHQLTTCLIGTGAVALLAVAGRRMAGPRAGLVAAGVGAVYPNLWLNDAALMSESLALALGIVAIIAAYRAWERATWQRFALVGGAIGLAALARAETLLLVVLLAAPLAAWAPGLAGVRQRTGRLVVAGLAAGVTIAPWVVPNLVRFEHPATLSTQLGVTLEAANCDATYYGQHLGSWSVGCASDHGTTDRSVVDRRTREAAFDYMAEHGGRLPVVLAARLGRVAGLYAPRQQLDFDVVSEARPREAAGVGLGAYYLLAPAAVAGAVVLRRRGVPSFPATSAVVNVAVTAVLFYGSTRFRAPAEPAIVLLAAVAIDRGLRSATKRDSGFGHVAAHR